MTWESAIEKAEELLRKADSPILESLSPKERKKLKKTLQATEPTEYFGQDFTKLGEILDLMKDLDLVKSDEKLTKKMKSFGEQNTDMVATAAKLRKTYEQLYRQLRGVIYPRSEGGLREEEL